MRKESKKNARRKDARKRTTYKPEEENSVQEHDERRCCTSFDNNPDQAVNDVIRILQACTGALQDDDHGHRDK